jgi:hypothetical protein
MLFKTEYLSGTCEGSLSGRPVFDSLQVIDSKWWPETGSNRRRRPFQGRLAMALSGLESADVVVEFRLVMSSV